MGGMQSFVRPTGPAARPRQRNQCAERAWRPCMPNPADYPSVQYLRVPSGRRAAAMVGMECMHENVRRWLTSTLACLHRTTARRRRVPAPRRDACVQRRSVPGTLPCHHMECVDCVHENMWRWFAEPLAFRVAATCRWRLRVPVPGGDAPVPIIELPGRRAGGRVGGMGCLQHDLWWRHSGAPARLRGAAAWRCCLPCGARASRL